MRLPIVGGLACPFRRSCVAFTPSRRPALSSARSCFDRDQQRVSPELRSGVTFVTISTVHLKEPHANYNYNLLSRAMSKQGNRQIVQYQDYVGIAPTQVEADGTTHITDDIPLEGCESHEFGVLNGGLEKSTDDSALLDTVLTSSRRNTADTSSIVSTIRMALCRWKTSRTSD